MQQIAEWLERLGLSEYAQRFAENCGNRFSAPVLRCPAVRLRTTHRRPATSQGERLPNGNAFRPRSWCKLAEDAR